MITDTIFNHPVTAAVIAGLLLVAIVGKLMKFPFERIAKWYLYISAFAVIIVMDSIFFPFIGGKDWFFRFTTELALACVVLWWAFEAKKGQLKERVTALFKNPLVRAVTAFVAAFELATIFSYDAYAAFWSNYERGEGGFQMLHYYLFFLLLVMLFKTEKEWKNLFRLWLVATAGVIIYGLFGDYSVPGFIGPYAGGTAPTGWFNQLIDGRFEGSLGNPAYLDPYLLFSMFFAGYLWVSSKLEGTLTALKSWGWGILMAILFFFFAIGQTRGAFLGLDAGIFIFLCYLAIHESKKIRTWTVGIALGSSAVFLIADKLVFHHTALGSILYTGLFGANFGSLVFLGGLAFGKSKTTRLAAKITLAVIAVVLAVGVPLGMQHLAAVNNVPESRVIQISASDTTAQTRFWVWGEAWKGFLERPVFGWGPENFTPVFDKFFNPNFYVPGQSTETWFDRAHSVYFDYLVETGIVGLLAYLGMFVVFFWDFIKNAHKNAKSDLHKALIAAIPVAYLVQGIAIFDVFPMYISLFAFLAFATYYFSVHRNPPHEA